MTRDQALVALAYGEKVKCTLFEKALLAITTSTFIAQENGIKRVPQIVNIIDQNGTIIPFEEIIEVYPSGDYYYIEYPPVKSLDDIKIGCWYDCGDDANVKILDKLSDGFIVLNYSKNHKTFCLTTYAYEYIEVNNWSRINPEYDKFPTWDKSVMNYISIDPSQLRIDQI